MEIKLLPSNGTPLDYWQDISDIGGHNIPLRRFYLLHPIELLKCGYCKDCDVLFVVNDNHEVIEKFIWSIAFDSDLSEIVRKGYDAW